LEFGPGFPGCFPGVAGVGGPFLVSSVVGFEPLPFGRHLQDKGFGIGCAGLVVLGFGVCGLLERVGFGLRGEPELAAHVRRSAGLGAFAFQDSRFEFAAVRAAHDVCFVAYLQRGLWWPAAWFRVLGC